MKFFFKFIGYIALFLFSVFFITELFFRFSVLGRDPVEVAADKYMQFLHERINLQWARLTTEGNDENQNPLEPPLKVISNQDHLDAERLNDIYNRTRSLKNTKLSSFDFLKDRKIADKTQYTACFNNIGIRSCSDTLKKSAQTKRIIVYGSYSAFGHGVNEDATYVKQLENRLNDKSRKSKFKYEVLNSGKHAGTAIIALAQLKKDIPELKPDLIVLDYGFVDTSIADDDVFPLVLLFDGNGQVAKFLLKAHSFLINNSRVFYLLWVKHSIRHLQERMQQFREVLKSTISLAVDKNIPVVILRQKTVRLKPSFYETIVKLYSNTEILRFVDGESYFAQNYSRFDQSVMPDHFWWNEISEADQKLLLQKDYFKYPKLMLDLFQLNENGHFLIAEALEKEISLLMSEKKQH